MAAKGRAIMDIKIAAGLFFVLWWVVWFAILPFAARRHAESLEAPPAGAEGRSFSLWRHAAIATAVTCVVFALVYAVLAGGLPLLDKLPL
jgi:predicted secreted protein